ncbi:lysozyme family protein [Mycolicibacterium sp. HS_4_1]
MQPSVQQAFVPFSKPFEGSVPYMYLDILGKVTVGIGNLIDSVAAASALPFVHNSDNSAASQSEIQAEWNKVHTTAGLAQKGYKSAAPPFTTLHLTDDAIAQLVANVLNANQAILKRTFPDFENWPADAQLGVLSMAWGLGAGFPATWPKFKASCLAQDWASAAQNCQINTAGNPGVIPRNAANVLLFNNAQAVAAQKLGVSVLHWPNSVPATAPDSGTPGNSDNSMSGSDGASGSNSTADPGTTDSSTSSTGTTDPGTTDPSSSPDATTNDDSTTTPTTDSSDSSTADPSSSSDATTNDDSTTTPTTDSSDSSTGVDPDGAVTSSPEGSDDVEVAPDATAVASATA